jgi:pyridoxal phosphate enzyme (YggS family)
MTDIKKNLERIKSELPDNVKLVAVSKTKPESDIQEAYETGQRIFGENKAQEMQGKAESLPDDIEWHMIGHLQRNKVKYIAPFVSLLHSVDSWRLLKEVNKRAKNEERVIDCLLQIHIAKEESKFGLDEDEVSEILYSEEFEKLENIRIVGLMGMATLTENEDQIRREFKSLQDLFDKIKNDKFSMEDSFKELSMGMSSDFKIAIEEGSTMIRIGSDIFGARNYG